MAIKNEGAARGTMRARDEEKNDGTDISIVIKLRIRGLSRKVGFVKKSGVCQEKCVSFFVSFFTSVNLFCYLQIYHHHF